VVLHLVKLQVGADFPDLGRDPVKAGPHFHPRRLHIGAERFFSFCDSPTPSLPDLHQDG